MQDEPENASKSSQAKGLSSTCQQVNCHSPLLGAFDRMVQKCESERLTVCRKLSMRPAALALSCSPLLLASEGELGTHAIKLLLGTNCFQLLRPQKHAPRNAAILLAVVQLVCHCAPLQVGNIRKRSHLLRHGLKISPCNTECLKTATSQNNGSFRQASCRTEQIPRHG